MSVANDLQDIVADLSAAIAARQIFGRTELEKLRRQLEHACRDMAAEHRGSVTARIVLEDMIAAVEANTIDLARIASRARTHAGIAPGACAVMAGNS